MEVIDIYNYNRLRGLIREMCGTQENYCKEIGIAQTTLNTRLKGETFFKQDEIEKTAKLFDLNSEDVNEIFFTKV